MFYPHHSDRQIDRAIKQGLRMVGGTASGQLIINAQKHPCPNRIPARFRRQDNYHAKRRLAAGYDDNIPF